MKVGIIGAGFVGLAAAESLSPNCEVTVIERSNVAGGLASGFKKNSWKWSLEGHYHHWFTNDYFAIETAKRLKHKVITVRPKTSILFGDNYYPFDSPASLLSFPAISLLDKLRVGATITALKVVPFWKPLEKISAVKFVSSTMGERAWNLLWEPLFVGKFGSETKKIPASWFWARIKKRTPSLSYPEGGFQKFADSYTKSLSKKGVKFEFSTEVRTVKSSKGKIVITTDKEKLEFDKVICTLPFSLFSKITKGLPASYSKKINSFKGIGAITIVLSLKNKLLTDGTYWLNVNNLNYPFLAVVEHTNFMNKKNYANEHLVYIGNYLPVTHDYFSLDSATLVKIFTPYIKRINKNFQKSWINNVYIAKAPFAQPVVTKNYSKKIPNFSTPLPNLFIANIQQVYPWDRGTNYAIELGQKVAKAIR